MFTLAISCWPLPIYLDSWTSHSRLLCNIILYSIRLYFHHQIHPQLGVVIALAQPLHLEGLILKLKLQYFGYLMWRADSFERTLMAGKDWGQKEKGSTEDEMVGWHHRLNGHGFVWTPGVGDGQGGLSCCGLWSRKESDTTEWLNWTDMQSTIKAEKRINS